SPDGTRLLTLMSPPNVTGVMDTNPITMVNYGIDWEVQTGLQEIFWLPGVGDHGGGPTRDMLEVAAKWDKSPFFPQVVFGTAGGYLEGIGLKSFAQSRRGAEREREREGLLVSRDVNGFKAATGNSRQEESKAEFPVWQDELYLELHRGCYTVHGDQKLYNRRCERLLYSLPVGYFLLLP
ncbi:MAG: alpha-mannosidase, partial [Cyanobacteria bacterium J06607_15]